MVNSPRINIERAASSALSLSIVSIFKLVPVALLLLIFSNITSNASNLIKCPPNNYSYCQGTFNYDSGHVYNGEFKNGLRHGYGILIWPSGIKYEGEWIDDFRNGYGVQTYENGDIYEGNFKDDIRFGNGLYTWLDGKTYDGDWNDLRNGNGKQIFTNGDVYNGAWVNGIREGFGVITYANGIQYSGRWLNDELYGVVTQVSQSGERIKGVWENGKFTPDATNIIKAANDTDQISQVDEIRDDNQFLSCKDYNGDARFYIKNGQNGKATIFDVFYLQNGMTDKSRKLSIDVMLITDISYSKTANTYNYDLSNLQDIVSWWNNTTIINSFKVTTGTKELLLDYNTVTKSNLVETVNSTLQCDEISSSSFNQEKDKLIQLFENAAIDNSNNNGTDNNTADGELYLYCKTKHPRGKAYYYIHNASNGKATIFNYENIIVRDIPYKEFDSQFQYQTSYYIQQFAPKGLWGSSYTIEDFKIMREFGELWTKTFYDSGNESLGSYTSNDQYRCDVISSSNFNRALKNAEDAIEQAEAKKAAEEAAEKQKIINNRKF